jgi:GH25 family lysozyme M1 (1,4-beta-N-acetylmuramidase)
MGKKKTKALASALFITIIIAITTLTASVIFALLYINEKNENSTLAGSLIVANEKVTTAQKENLELEEAVAAFNELETKRSEEELESIDEKGVEVESDLREKAKMALTSENGSPIRALREVFPENFIYYDEGEYAFLPVLDEVSKHSLLSENFVKTEDGEIQYVESGTVTSHKGIDVSKYQGTIDWSKVKSDGIEYVFIRLGLRGYESGKIVLDDYFKSNIRGANNAGVNAGVYFFTQAITIDEAVEEAQFVIESIEGYDVSCPIVFDVEMVDSSKARANSLSQEDRTDITIAFCDTIKAAGYTPMIYGNVKCFTKLLDMTRLEDYEKWYAFYDDYMYMPYNVSCWQYTEKGSVNGIKGNVDLNISYKLW